MSVWLTALLIGGAVVVIVLVARCLSRLVARRDAEVRDYFARQVDELARLAEQEQGVDWLAVERALAEARQAHAAERRP